MNEVEGPEATVLVAARPETVVPLQTKERSIVVVRADSGAQALVSARESTPAVILLDLMLPDSSGLEICRKLRGDPLVDRSVPILLLTSTQPTPEQRVAALRFGAWDFVRLPTDETELTLKIRLYADAKRHFDNAVASERVDQMAGVHSTAELVRHAQQLGALMHRVHTGLACVVFEVNSAVTTSSVAAAIARSVRSSDMVGLISNGRIGIVAPATTPAGAVVLARRVAVEARRAMVEDEADLTFNSKARLLAGYDAVANARYSPVDPVGLIRNASFAIRNGVAEAGEAWLRASSTVVKEASPDGDRSPTFLARSST